MEFENYKVKGLEIMKLYFTNDKAGAKVKSKICGGG
jgi:hypothetical protein